MTTAARTTVDIEALHALIREHRKILDALESQLAAITTPASPEAPPALLPARDDRVARSALRRAARRVQETVEGDVWVAMPVESERSSPALSTDIPSIGSARRNSWRQSSAAMAALQRGDAQSASDALSAIYEIERSIQIAVDAIKLPAVWREVADELTRAGDLVIDATWNALSILEATPSHTARCIPPMTRVMTGQSNWNRAWRTFVQVIPASAA